MPILQSTIRKVKKTGIEINQYRRVKKGDPQAVQRGRLFRAVLFVRFSCWFGCYGVRLYRRAKRADLYNTSARRSAKTYFNLLFLARVFLI